MTRSAGERLLETHLKAFKVGGWVPEYRFDSIRRWRADFAFPKAKLLVEVEGGTWTQGRHTRGKGFEADCDKYNAAATLGWRVLRFTPGMIKRGEAVNVICGAL